MKQRPPGVEDDPPRVFVEPDTQTALGIYLQNAAVGQYNFPAFAPVRLHHLASQCR